MRKLKWVHYLGILVLLVFLFYLSPFSEVEYPTKCFVYPYERDTPVGAQLEPMCDAHIQGESYNQPIFPFKEKISEKSEFCKKNVENIEKLCGFEVNEVTMQNLKGFQDHFQCHYVTTDQKRKSVWTDMVIIRKFSEEYLKSKKQEGEFLSPIEIFEVHTKDSKRSNETVCKDLEKYLED